MANKKRAGGPPSRRRVSVPSADVSVLAWWDAQDDPSASVRMLVREEIERNGVTDKVNRPVSRQPRRGRPPGLTGDQTEPPGVAGDQNNLLEDHRVPAADHVVAGSAAPMTPPRRAARSAPIAPATPAPRRDPRPQLHDDADAQDPDSDPLGDLMR